MSGLSLDATYADLVTSAAGTQHIHNTVTGDTFSLAGQPWSLEDDGEAQWASLQSEGPMECQDTSIWVHDKFRLLAYRGMGVGTIILDKLSQQKMPLDTFNRKHQCYSVAVPIAGTIDGARVQVFRLFRPCLGFRWWWDFHDLAGHTLSPFRQGSSKRCVG